MAGALRVDVEIQAGFRYNGIKNATAAMLCPLLCLMLLTAVQNVHGSTKCSRQYTAVAAHLAPVKVWLGLTLSLERLRPPLKSNVHPTQGRESWKFRLSLSTCRVCGCRLSQPGST